ncbi:oxidoreductase CipA-like protein [Coniochaeta ligniaria NRRL 30616]|uniref:Oxidoreductase CipA-like protein n=1 Tax=Coniochaeta ligniaria NRRL 30616 TaxID=1408157 RepID=A0A1J7ILG4_9PEZI|nr:oxidoreductase CipA-like protein [Coniochaeta ligniaria NRRL 30616]
MASSPTIALAGATGGLGPAVLEELLANNFHVTLLTRQGSNSAGGVAKSELLNISEIGYSDIKGMTDVLRGIDVVVSTVGNPGLDNQIPLIDAAVAAGVKRFIPSEFGADPEHEKNKPLPFYIRKLRILDHLKEKAANNPGFSYSRVTTHAFLDWGITEGFLLNPKVHQITIYNGGNTRFSVTTLRTIARAIVAIANNLDGTKNRPVFVHDAAITQNQLVRYAKEADGIDWAMESMDTKQLLHDSLEEMKKPNPDLAKAMRGLTFVAVYDEDHGPDLTDRLSNKLLGLPVMTEKEVAEVIKKAMLAA